ncbi:MAG TPA: ABC transporter permease [Longimicrobiales bacterium]|jgi:predicted permease
MSLPFPHRIARAVVRVASFMAPAPERARFVREWVGELDSEVERGARWAVVRVAWGAFADAGAMSEIANRQTDRDGRWTVADSMTGWIRDLSLALRGMRRSPGFTAVAVITLALGIGGSAAIYTLVDRVVLDPLPYPDADRLVRLQNQVPGVGPDAVWNLSTAQWVHFTDNATTLEEVGLYRGTGGTVVTPTGAERVRSVMVTASMMPLLGARASLGRVISENDAQPAANLVALVSHGFWERALAADPGAPGTVLTYQGQAVEVIGVLEEGLELPGWSSSSAPDVWVPLRIDREGDFYNNHVFSGIGLLAPEATPGSAEAEMVALTDRLPDRFPQAYSQAFFDQYGFRTQVKPLKEDVLGNLARNLWILFGGVGLVLLIACANVANLFVVRMEARKRELAVRASLGAGRPALARLVLAEGLALAFLGASLALVVGFWTIPVLTSLAPDLPRVRGVSMDLGSVGFTLGLSLLVGLAVAAYPVLLHAGPGAASGSSEGGRGSSAGRRQQTVRSAMVVTQVALALTLVVGAGLLLETLAKLRQADPGVDPEGVVAVDLYLSSQRYPDDLGVWGFYRDLLERVRALPSVASAGMTVELPVAGGFGCTVQAFEDETVYDRVKAAGLTTCAGQEPTTPGYFETMGIPLLAGRTFTDSDNTDGTAVIVSKAFAEQFWPGEDPLGKGLAPSGRSVGPFHTVVGVVDDVARRSREGEAPLSQPAMAVYYPIRQHPGVEGNWYWWPGQMTLVARTGLEDPRAVFPEIRRLVGELDPEVPLSGMTTMDDIVDDASSELAFISLLLSIAAGVAMLLAAVGLYGVLSFVVSRRTREIGTRLAIGARPAEVQRMVVGGALALVAMGLVAGVLLALATTRVLEGLLVGVEPTDPAAYGLAALTLATVAALASWLPARRASRIDPVEALRAE